MDFKANTIDGVCACDDEFDVVNGQCIPPLPAIAWPDENLKEKFEDSFSIDSEYITEDTLYSMHWMKLYSLKNALNWTC